MRSRNVWRILLMVGALALLAATVPISAASAVDHTGDPDLGAITLDDTTTSLRFNYTGAGGAATTPGARAWGADMDDTWELTVATACEAFVHIEWFDAYPSTKDTFTLYVDGVSQGENPEEPTAGPGQAGVWLSQGTHTIMVDWIQSVTFPAPNLDPGGAWYDITFEVAEQSDCATTSCPSGQTFVSAVGVDDVTTPESVAVASGYPYELTVEGTFFAGGHFQYDIRADAKYSQDAYQRAHVEPWTDLVRGYHSWGEELLEMKVDDGFVDWGAFATDHSYTIPYTATGSAIDFQIYDIYAQNNTGGLCVDVEPVALRRVSGGGQIIEEIGPKVKDNLKVSFGGHIDDIGGELVCNWQVNLHNVGGTDLDGSKFHTTTCTELNTWKTGIKGADGVANFTATGTFDGVTGYTAIFRMEDYTEPGAQDTFRLTINGPGGFVYDTHAAGEFSDESNNVGTARTLLDNGNIQISFYE